MKKITIIGLGYVGLPLAVEFAKKRQVIGYDIKEKRITELRQAIDPTLEVSENELKEVLQPSIPLLHKDGKGLFLTNSLNDIADSRIYIIAVPTPINKYNQPDISMLLQASETVGKVLKEGDIVIYESTVYPGATEEDCVPVLEKASGKQFNQHFFVGYSPERINPGDKINTLPNIIKVTSGSTPEIRKEVDELYREIIRAGTHSAPSIKVAEAAKVIENAQRDINIAFVNELSKIFNRLGIDTLEVLEAAGTKWNFLPFKPGLVGGHCIGVDPYYLAQKALETAYNPEIILAGRRLNDGMGAYVARELIKLMIQAGQTIKNSRVLILGITFKENCPDIRNTGTINIYTELKSFGTKVDFYDPWANPKEVNEEYGIDILETFPQADSYGAIILAVAHEEFKNIDLKACKEKGIIVYDVKGLLPKEDVSARL